MTTHAKCNDAQFVMPKLTTINLQGTKISQYAPLYQMHSLQKKLTYLLCHSTKNLPASFVEIYIISICVWKSNFVVCYHKKKKEKKRKREKMGKRSSSLMKKIGRPNSR